MAVHTRASAQATSDGRFRLIIDLAITHSSAQVA